jgi:hypothetical protein
MDTKTETNCWKNRDGYIHRRIQRQKKSVGKIETDINIYTDGYKDRRKRTEKQRWIQRKKQTDRKIDTDINIYIDEYKSKQTDRKIEKDTNTCTDEYKDRRKRTQK